MYIHMKRPPAQPDACALVFIHMKSDGEVRPTRANDACTFIESSASHHLLHIT
jgi:hypothetical protein